MSQFRNIVKKAVVIGLCICTFSVQVSGATPWSSANGIFYDGNGNEIKGAIAKGIDVSYHNGDIDWAKVKAAGISFALLRCGYGNDERNQDDIKFVQNVKGCEDNGIQYGVYLYSYAVGNDKEKTLEDMARSEAEHVLRMIEEAGAKPTMPVYYDIEDKSQVEMTTKQYGDMAEIFCNIVKNAGYKVGVYSNYYWWTNRLTDSRFDNWGKWVARYNNTSEYNKEYDIWQYTESGTVDGVGSGMDVNILLSRPCSITGHQYEFYQLVSKSTTTINGKATYKCKTCGHIKTTDIAKINQITISKTKYEYTGKAFKPTVTVKDSNGQVISTQNYNIIYSSNKKVGNGTVKIVFKGNYSGTITKIFKIVPHAPISLLNVPIYSFEILDCPIADAHIEHGSIVTYILAPLNLQSPNILHASSIAKISACDIIDLLFSLKLCALAITTLSFTITAPTGTSPFKYAFLASSKAICI